MHMNLAPLLYLLLLSTCHQPKPKLGGPCEGCEALLDYGTRALLPTDTLPEFQTTAPKMKVYGTVYRKDGKTPAADVVLYLYHTNRQGIYPTRGNEKDWAKKHGYLRGWVKTGKDGRYAFYTFRPTAYPDRSEPEHMHITLKEPGKIPYYLDDFQFLDDPGLKNTERLPQRGGSGLVRPQAAGQLLLVKRDIVLGKNIPNYE